MNGFDPLAALAARWALGGWSKIASPRLSILTFHRVPPATDPLFPNEVQASRFDSMMAAVARAYKVLPLTEAVRALSQGTLPTRALTITFDDGYADNEEVALPILQRHGLHATFFVATGFLDGGRMWNDTVIECFRHTARTAVDLQALGLGLVPTQTLPQRQQAIGLVIPVIKYMDLRAREDALGAVIEACGSPNLSRTLMMKRTQVQRLHAAGMEIGAHTVNHPILKSLSDDAARDELLQGRNQLEGLLGTRIRTLAYPNGRPDVDYDWRHAVMARELGFDCAVTTAVGVSQTGDDVFQLPRFTPWDVSVPRWLGRLVLNQNNSTFQVARTKPRLA